MARRENFEGDSFEQEWKDAFEDASEQPNPGVWSNIERDLAYQQMASLKRKAMFYQWAAAAAMFIAAFLGINYLISDKTINNNILTDSNSQEVPLQDQLSSNEPSDIERFAGTIAGTIDREENNQKPLVYTSDVGDANNRNTKSRTGYFLSNQAEDEELTPKYLVFALDGMRIEQANVQYTIDANVERRMYNKPINGKFLPRKSRRAQGQEKFWAGVGIGSGSFDPNYQSGPSNLLASSLNLSTAENYAASNSFRIESQSPAVREGMKSGSTIDMGLNFGVRVSSNWIVESGIYYTQADAVTQTNVVVESPNVVEPIAASSETRGVTELNSLVGSEKIIQYSYQDVNFDNTFQFASLPVKAGFILIDNRLNIVLNAGIATNLYLGNKLEDPNSDVANVSIGPGKSSPYREISFAGLGGLQIGYALFDQVEFTIEPYMRQPITSLTKQNTSFVASPSGLGINTGIRYRFN
tara:strand:+ start:2685 stop:4091 length:1407 start_codon:yes stop_codon:yes gene_type:complete